MPRSPSCSRQPRSDARRLESRSNGKGEGVDGTSNRRPTSAASSQAAAVHARLVPRLQRSLNHALKFAKEPVLDELVSVRIRPSSSRMRASSPTPATSPSFVRTIATVSRTCAEPRPTEIEFSSRLPQRPRVVCSHAPLRRVAAGRMRPRDRDSGRSSSTSLQGTPAVAGRPADRTLS